MEIETLLNKNYLGFGCLSSKKGDLLDSQTGFDYLGK